MTPPPSTFNVLTETVSSQWRTAVVSQPRTVPRPLEPSSCVLSVFHFNTNSSDDLHDLLV